MENLLQPWESILTTNNVTFTTEDEKLEAKIKIYIHAKDVLLEKEIELVIKTNGLDEVEAELSGGTMLMSGVCPLLAIHYFLVERKLHGKM